MILVFAGNRTDEPGRSNERFPSSNVEQVRTQIANLLVEQKPSIVVGAAAAGADLIMLSEAGRLLIPTHIVLPLQVDAFRSTSVNDRSDEWADLFDNAIQGSSALTICDLSEHEDWYLRGNDLILNTADLLAGEDAVIAVVIAAPDDSESASADFRGKAAARGWPILPVNPRATGSER